MEEIINVCIEGISQHVKQVDSISESIELETVKSDGRWKDDLVLKDNLMTIKSLTSNLTDLCTKINMVCSSNTTADAVKSITDEILSSSNALLIAYSSLIGCNISKPLRSTIKNFVKIYLTHVHDLLVLLARKNLSFVNSATGLVWNANQEIQKIPLNNRNAYRRSILEAIAVVKDTLTEFRSYIQQQQQSPDKINNDLSDKDNEEEEGEEDDEEEEKYSVEELEIVKSCLILIDFHFYSIKGALDIMTQVADTINNNATTSPTSPSPPPAFTPPPTVVACNVWIDTLYTSIEDMKNAIIDLGAELYTPIDVDGVHSYYSTAWKCANTLMTTINDFMLLDEISTYGFSSEAIRNIPLLLAQLFTISEVPFMPRDHL